MFNRVLLLRYLPQNLIFKTHFPFFEFLFLGFVQIHALLSRGLHEGVSGYASLYKSNRIPNWSL